MTEGLSFDIARDLSLEVETAEPGHSVMRAVAGDQHVNPNGVVHGAAVFAVVDTSMGAATMSVLGEGKFCASIEVHLRFLRPLMPGAFRADTRVVHPGKRVVQLGSQVFDANDQLVATASGSFAVLS